MSCSSISDVIINKSGLYQGNLKYYFKIIFDNARNLSNPYHNFRHIFHVTWLCHSALEFYQESNKKINKIEARNLLIAAMFHDHNHPGRTGNDDLNIDFAIRGLKENILPEDEASLKDIEHYIRCTEFPVRPEYARETLSLPAQILCDADISQALSVAWIQQIVFGLADEMNMTPRKILELQEMFLGGLKFYSEWANHTFPRSVIEAKIQESKDLLFLLS